MNKLGPYELNSIITGDARELAKAIPDDSVDLIFTDPPWGIGFDYSNGYNDSPDQYIELIRWLIKDINRVLRPGRFAFVYQATKRLREVWQYFPENSRLFASCKNFIQLKSIPIEYAIDYIIFWQKDGDFKNKGMCKDWHIANTAITNSGSRGLGSGPRKKATSPPRPLDAAIDIINQMTAPKDIVMDYFMGSGTTAVACKIINRDFLGFELIDETADFARQRVANTQPPLPIVYHEQLELLTRAEG